MTGPGDERLGRPTGIDVVLPAFNEAATIEVTVRSWLDAVGQLTPAGRVIVTEDGSTDSTPDIVRRLGDELDVVLLHHDERLGYSEAVTRGIRATGADLVVCADADGQCDPADLPALVDRWARESDPAAGIVVGARLDRSDPRSRRLMSRLMRAWYRLVHGIRLQDPSSPFVVGGGDSMRRIARATPRLAQGYWWEFHVRARRAGLGVTEVPIRHRARLEGPTRVYRPLAVPGIALRHVVGIWRLRDLT